MKLVKGSHLCELGALLVPFSGVFIGQRNGEQSRFAPICPDQLQTDGQTGGREAARNRNCGMAREIGGPVQAHEGGPHCFFPSPDHYFLLADT